MNVIVDCPQSSAGEWRFRLFDIDVRVKIWFWIAVAVMCGAQDTGGVLIWVAVCFVSILIHEFGHVLAFRYFRERADVVLYGWGGLTIPYHNVRGTGPRFAVALAGPAAGFCVTAATLAVASLSGAGIRVGWHLVFPVLTAGPATRVLPGQPAYLWYAFLNDLLWVNFYWGLLNLLPVFPLDGGHAAQAVLEQHDPYRGRRKALMLSAAVAGVMAALGAVDMNFYMLLVFVVLGVSSLQALEETGSGAPRPYRR
jgi:membrane-associated protease RseP (regulator of RpoE activity)